MCNIYVVTCYAMAINGLKKKKTPQKIYSASQEEFSKNSLDAGDHATKKKLLGLSAAGSRSRNARTRRHFKC